MILENLVNYIVKILKIKIGVYFLRWNDHMNCNIIKKKNK